MLQAEKRIRLRSLINMGFDLKNIQAIFEESNNTTVLRNDVSNLVDAIPENCFDQSLDDADQAIVYLLFEWLCCKEYHKKCTKLPGLH